MTLTDVIGFIGVAILLVAYFLNLIGKIKKDGLIYLIMNVIGAATACFASALLHYLPFIILEASWALVSVIGMIFYFKNRKAPQ